MSISFQVLCGRGRHVITQAAAYQALTALCIGRTRNFSAASSDEPYVTISPSDAGETFLPNQVFPARVSIKYLGIEKAVIITID